MIESRCPVGRRLSHARFSPLANPVPKRHLIGARPKSLGPELESPCVKVCQLDNAKGVCIGCLRTLPEIARWSQMSGDERRRVMADLPNRKAP